LTPPTSPLFPYTPLFRSLIGNLMDALRVHVGAGVLGPRRRRENDARPGRDDAFVRGEGDDGGALERFDRVRSGFGDRGDAAEREDRKSTRLNSSHLGISY